MMTVTTKSFEFRELTLEDRCIRCSAAALHRLMKNIDDKPLEMLFCGHHFRANEPALLTQGWWLQGATNG